LICIDARATRSVQADGKRPRRDTVATNVSDVIDNARFNGFHLRITVLCGVLVFLDGFDLTAISYAAPQFIKLFGITRAMIAPVFSSGLLGLTLGAFTGKLDKSFVARATADSDQNDEGQRRPNRG